MMLNRYMMPNNGDSLWSLVGRRILPRYHSPGGCRGGCSYCRCMCWFYYFLLLFLVAISGITVYFFLIFSPEAPSYSIDHLSVGAFNIHPKDLALFIKVIALVHAENPNDMIGIYYKKGSKVVIVYRDVTLCQSHIASFYQRPRDKTVIPVVEGCHGIYPDLQETLKEDQVVGRIPVDIYMRVPGTLQLDDLDLREFIVNVACSLVVENLSPSAKVGIKSVQFTSQCGVLKLN